MYDRLCLPCFFFLSRVETICQMFRQHCNIVEVCPLPSFDTEMELEDLVHWYICISYFIWVLSRLNENCSRSPLSKTPIWAYRRYIPIIGWFPFILGLFVRKDTHTDNVPILLPKSNQRLYQDCSPIKEQKAQKHMWSPSYIYIYIYTYIYIHMNIHYSAWVCIYIYIYTHSHLLLNNSRYHQAVSWVSQVEPQGLCSTCSTSATRRDTCCPRYPLVMECMGLYIYIYDLT